MVRARNSLATLRVVPYVSTRMCSFMQSGHAARALTGNRAHLMIFFCLQWAVPTARLELGRPVAGVTSVAYIPPPIEPARNLILVQVWIALRDPAGGLAGQVAPGPCHPSAEPTPTSIAGHSRGRFGHEGRTRTIAASPWIRRTGWGSTWRRGLDRSLAQADHDGKLGTPDGLDHHTLGAEPSVMLRGSTNLWYGMVSGSLPMPTLLPGGWAPNGASFWMDGWIAISFAGIAEDVQKSPIAHLASALPSPCGIPLPPLDSGGNALPIGWVLRAAFRCSVHDSQSSKADIVRLSGQKDFPPWPYYISRPDYATVVCYSTLSNRAAHSARRLARLRIQCM